MTKRLEQVLAELDMYHANPDQWPNAAHAVEMMEDSAAYYQAVLEKMNG